MRKLALFLVLLLSLALPVLADDFPNPALTPGQAAFTDQAMVCQKDFLTRINPRPHIPVALQKRVFDAYSIPWADRKKYELDHLVMRGIGGADTEANLWPQAWNTEPWNARVKDRLERWMRKRVCAGEMSLIDAQEAMARDWIGAYKSAFGEEVKGLPKGTRSQ